MLKIRRPLGRLIFNMGIAIPGKTVFLIETAPWLFKGLIRPTTKISSKLYITVGLCGELTIFAVLSPLCGEFTGDRIPCTKGPIMQICFHLLTSSSNPESTSLLPLSVLNCFMLLLADTYRAYSVDKQICLSHGTDCLFCKHLLLLTWINFDHNLVN